MLFLTREKQMKIRYWEVSDKFWAAVAPLIPKTERSPEKEYTRKAGGGRKPIEPRTVFAGIVYVLRTGIHWKALPKEIFGSPSAIHRYFREWEHRGIFQALWAHGLSEYDEMEGIAWRWQSRESSGANPTDREKTRRQAPPVCGRAWCPVVHRRNRGEQA